MWRDDILAIAKKAKTNGWRIIFIKFPWWKTPQLETNRPGMHLRLLNRSFFFDSLHLAGEVETIDMENTFHHLTSDELPNIFKDYAHMKIIGSEMFSKSLAPKLKEYLIRNSLLQNRQGK